MDFSMEDLKSISILATSLENFPDKILTDEIKKFITSLEFRMNSNDRNSLNNLNNTLNYDFSFYYSDLREQIEHCEMICKENYVINLIYKKNNKEIKCKCTPKEVTYDSKTAFLMVYDASKRQNLEIPISNILSITTLPQVANRIEMSTTVVYKLKNRLAKNYHIRDNETSSIDSNGDAIIINKGESFDKLISRLMRYTDSCEIISPKIVRDEMIKTINETLSNYENQ